MKDVFSIELSYNDTIADLEEVIKAFNEECIIEYLLNKIVISSI